jgi:hypothetical protein
MIIMMRSSETETKGNARKREMSVEEEIPEHVLECKV